MANSSLNSHVPRLFATLESADTTSRDVPDDCTEFFRFRFGANGENFASNVFPLAIKPIGVKTCDEVWYTHGPTKIHEDQGIKIVESPDYLVLHVEHAISADSIGTVTESCYYRLYELAQNLGYEHLQRAWNYLPQINQGKGDNERYRQFSFGRSIAFEKLGLTKNQFPAATAIGTDNDSSLTITLIAAKQSCVMLENPRQVSAYEYPQQYGKRGPSFSRAALVPAENYYQLLISGTASIIGHASHHTDNIIQQCKEAMLNIDTLIGVASSEFGNPSAYANDWSHACFRVYLRQADDLNIIRNEIADKLVPLAHIVFLRGDICREELMVEIEGNYLI
jgi:chorismate lyase / 3-hydroxybenzoate synthase